MHPGLQPRQARQSGYHQKVPGYLQPLSGRDDCALREGWRQGGRDIQGHDPWGQI